jgi:hypothetical protein
VKRFIAFCEWFAARGNKKLSPAGMVALMMAVSFPEDPAVNTWQQLESIFWYPNVDKSELEAAVTEAWKEVLKLEKEMPE